MVFSQTTDSILTLDIFFKGMNMQAQIKTQVEASVKAAFELANLSFSQVERLTELSLEQAKVNASWRKNNWLL